MKDTVMRTFLCTLVFVTLREPLLLKLMLIYSNMSQSLIIVWFNCLLIFTHYFLRRKFKDSWSNARAVASRVKYRKAKGLFVRCYKTSVRIAMIIAQKINDQTICQYFRKKNDNCHVQGIVFQHIACTTISVLKRNRVRSANIVIPWFHT